MEDGWVWRPGGVAIQHLHLGDGVLSEAYFNRDTDII